MKELCAEEVVRSDLSRCYGRSWRGSKWLRCFIKRRWDTV